jgi:hypothetical protein
MHNRPAELVERNERNAANNEMFSTRKDLHPVYKNTRRSVSNIVAKWREKTRQETLSAFESENGQEFNEIENLIVF